jgi:thiol peroxidase
MTKVTIQGNPFAVKGTLPNKGDSAADFNLTNAKMSDVNLAEFAGKKKLMSIFPSIDTPTCAISTKKFNDYAAAHDDTVMLMISADLPFAHGRFCGAEGLDNVHTLSTMRDKDFAENYGVLLAEGPLAGITARAVVVLDADNKVLHSQLVGEIGDEPDYESALAALA